MYTSLISWESWMSCLDLTLTVSVVFQAPCQCCFVAVRSVGTFARALDCSSSVKQPSLHMSAAAASRDITLVNTSVPPRIRQIRFRLLLGEARARFIVLPKFVRANLVPTPMNFTSSRIYYSNPASTSSHGCLPSKILLRKMSSSICLADSRPAPNNILIYPWRRPTTVAKWFLRWPSCSR